MPTTARLVAAICLAILAWSVSAMVMDAMPERQQWGHFQLANAAIALLVGWIVIGKRVGTDYVTAVGIGFTGMVAMVFWVLFAHSFAEMIDMSLNRRFSGPVEAIVGIFTIGLEYGAILLNPRMILWLIMGGIGTGLIAEFVHRRWS